MANPRKLAGEVVRRHGRDQIDLLDVGHIDLADQIATKARITVRKLRLFSLSVLCFGGGVLSCAAGIVTSAITK